MDLLFHSPHMIDLATLLHPVTIHEFFARYHERAPLVLRREQPDWYAALLTLADVDRILTGTGLRYPALRIVRDGAVVPVEEYTRDFPWGSAVFQAVVEPDRAIAAYRQGATLIFEALHRYWPPLGYLCRSLETQLGHPVQTNVYLTPPQAQGFSAHYDSHDVLVLQLSGSKHWRLYQGPRTLPGQRQAFRKERDRPGALIDELELGPGDLLYLPRGVMHEAATSATPSLHATIGLLPYTWRDVLRRAIDLLDEDVALRESIPTGARRPSAATLAAAFAERVQLLARRADPAGILDALEDEFARTRSPLVDGGLLNAFAAEAVTIESRLRLRRGLLWTLRPAAGERIELRFHHTVMSLPAHAEPAVRLAAAGEPFHVRELPDLDAPGQLTLARQLVAEGFLVNDAPREGP